MTYEAVKLEHGAYNARTYTCDSATAITKGALLKLVDPYTASGANIEKGSIFAGIAAMDKSATDGTTKISCWTDGIFKLYTNIAINNGSLVCLSGGNMIVPANADTLLSGSYIGKALEAGAAAEYVRVAVGSPI